MTSFLRSGNWPARSLLCALLLCFLTCRPAPASNDKESMRLLVEALGKVQEDPGALKSLMKGMLLGLEGRRDVDPPANWSALAVKLEVHADADVRDLARQLSGLFGDESAIQRALGTITNTSVAADVREKTLRVLLAQQNVEASKLLEGLLDDPQLQLTAVRGYADVENKAAPSILLKRYKSMSPELRRAAIETLATRKPYAEAMLAAVQDKAIPRGDIPTHVARSLNGLLGEKFVAVFGKPPTLAVDREKLIARWKSRITPKRLATADVMNGRRVFMKTCASCHLLYGEGGKIGPDLTGSNRANLDYLLLNSVDPSYDVPAGYKMVTILTEDGRSVSGVIAEEDAVRVILKTVENPRLVIAKADIDERVVSKKSMMPDGQLESLRPQEVFDLIKYLRTTEQVELAK